MGANRLFHAKYGDSYVVSMGVDLLFLPPQAMHSVVRVDVYNPENDTIPHRGETP